MTNKVQENSNDNSEVQSKYIAQNVDVESGERTETVSVTKKRFLMRYQPCCFLYEINWTVRAKK